MRELWQIPTALGEPKTPTHVGSGDWLGHGFVIVILAGSHLRHFHSDVSFSADWFTSFIALL
jgi:hypothetical protein